MKKTAIVLSILLSVTVLLVSFACGKNETETQQELVNAEFVFDGKESVIFGYGSKSMGYPYQQSANVIQLFAGENETTVPQFDYEVKGGALTIKTSGNIETYLNVGLRIYSTAFDGYNQEQRVRVKMQLKIDRACLPQMFVAYNDANFKEKIEHGIPKSGEFSQWAFDTAIETSYGFHRNNLNAGNAKNVMVTFLRLTANTEFSIDNIAFEI